jgi:aminoglycoside phosphotransferase (APT) family kinase protein
VAISDAALRHLRHVADLPDLGGTRYELVEPLGRGGMGAVYRVRDTALDREVAMKVLAGAALGESRARLEQEARILARLEHPGIVPVHDVGTLPDGRLFYVMKLVHGHRLDAVAQRVSSVPERLRLIIRVADAVAFAHAHGVVHRDLSPANIMVGTFGEVLVVDWGLAQVASPEPATGSAAVVAGTPGFIAPEQAEGRATPASDVFSLGAILRWWMAPERGGPARLPRALASVVERATAGDASRRYPSAAAFAADLAAYLDGEHVAAHRESASERVVRFAKRYRVAILLVLGYLLMRVALLVVRGL